MNISRFLKLLLVFILIFTMVACSPKKVRDDSSDILLVDGKDTVLVGNRYKSLVVKSSGSVLKDGKLDEILIESSVGDGDITLSKIWSNKLDIRGGGEDSIHIINSSNIKKVDVRREEGPVRIHSDNLSKIKSIHINEGSKDVIIEGNVEEVFIEAKDINISTETGIVDRLYVNARVNLSILGEVGQIEMGKRSGNTTIVVEEYGLIGLIKTDTSVNISGSGYIKRIVNNKEENINEDLIGRNTGELGAIVKNKPNNPSKNTGEPSKTINIPPKIENLEEDKEAGKPKDEEKDKIEEVEKSEEGKKEKDFAEKEEVEVTEEPFPPSTPKIYHSVSFIGLDGNEIRTINVEKGREARPPEPPAIEGYSFIGWDRDLTSIREDIIVKAQYEKNKYKVSFDTNGGSEIEDIEVSHGDLLDKPKDPTREGYEFKGWFIDKGLLKLWDFAMDKVKGFITLFAKWERIKSSDTSLAYIKVDGLHAEATDDPSIFRVEFHDKVDLESLTEESFEIKTKDTHAKVGEFRKEDKGSIWYFVVTAEDGRREKYTVKIVVYHKVTFNLNGASLNGSSEDIVISVESGKRLDIQLEKPILPFHNFIAWGTKSPNDFKIETDIVNNDIILNAYWNEKCIIIENDNGIEKVDLKPNGKIKNYPTLSWIDETNTLIMNGYKSGKISQYSSILKNINIKVIGENTISSGKSVGIYFTGGITIEGEGVLNIDSRGNHAIETKNLEIRGVGINIIYNKSNGDDRDASAINANTVISRGGSLSIVSQRESKMPNRYIRGIQGVLTLNDTSFANICLIEKVNGSDLIGVSKLTLNGNGNSEISILGEKARAAKAISEKPIINSLNYKIDGSWDEKYVKYYVDK